MKLPFPEFLAKADIRVTIEEIGRDGIEEVRAYTGKCIFDEKSRTTLTADKRLITLGARAIIKGDIYPNKDILGKVKVNGVTRKIAGSRRPRNPDGTVFSTELDLE